MFVTLKDGSHGEITLAEARRIALDIDAKEEEYARLNPSEILGLDLTPLTPAASVAYGHAAFSPRRTRRRKGYEKDNEDPGERSHRY